LRALGGFDSQLHRYLADFTEALAGRERLRQAGETFAAAWKR